MSFLQTPIYQASARVLILPDQSLFNNASGQAVDNNLIQNQIQVMQSQPVVQATAAKVGSLAHTSIVPVGQTSVILVRDDSTSPSRAATVANAYANAYIDYSRKQNVSDLLSAGDEIQKRVDSIQKQVDALTAQLDGLPSCTGNNPPPECGQRAQLQSDRDALVTQLVPLKQRLDQLQVDANFNKGGPQLLTPAAIPTTPIKPTPKRNAVMGFGVGLLFGVALAFALEHFDDSIKSKEDLERLTGNLPVLGMIPTIGSWKNREETFVVARTEPSSPAAEAYRALRTSIHFLALDRAIRVLMVTSPNASEGKSTAVANLATVLARAGERVVVVSCDLRRPRLHEFFGMSNAVGFTSVLLGTAPLSSVLQPVANEERLSILASGPLPPNPSELLASERTSDLFVALRARADIVLLDAPPVLPVTDAAVLSARADGVLLVANAGATSGKHVVRALELLRQVGAPLTGAVLNSVTAEDGYGYAYEYYSREVPRNERSSNRNRKQPANP
jgi:capsular exopolysaccharide synthesis family protein